MIFTKNVMGFITSIGLCSSMFAGTPAQATERDEGPVTVHTSLAAPDRALDPSAIPLTDYKAKSRKAPRSQPVGTRKRQTTKWGYLSQEAIDGIQFDYAGIIHFGANNIIGAAIKILTRSLFTSTPVSHTGVLLRNRETDEWYCLEATGSAGEVLRGRYPFTRITPLDDLVANYGGFVAVEPLSYASYLALRSQNIVLETEEQRIIDGGAVPSELVDVSESGEHFVDYAGNQLNPGGISMTAFARWFNDRAYEKNFLQLVLSVVNLNKGNGLNAQMCSTTAYSCGTMMGVLEVDPEDPLASNVLPIELVNARTLAPFANDNYQKVKPRRHINGNSPSEFLTNFFDASRIALERAGVLAPVASVSVEPEDRPEEGPVEAVKKKKKRKGKKKDKGKDKIK